jgi:3-methyladenine DNA glycosylase/8-oxoguanine DNA glycosylase
MMPTTFDLPLAGPKGEPVDFARTIMSHGVADLPPGRVDEEAPAYETTLALPPPARPRTIRISAAGPGLARVEVRGPRLGARAAGALLGTVRRILNLDEDLSGFYAVAAEDPELAWAARGAGRMLRTPTVFEAVVKTVCTTNCAWTATVRMVSALVEHLGESALGSDGHAFPSAEAMASAPEAFYREVVRAGYRSAYLRALAASVAEGSLDLAGIGPYGTAHMMMLLGRHSRLVLDSWTRPKYARVRGRKASDKTIERRFRRYGRYAGLAFWLYLTRDWVSD